MTVRRIPALFALGAAVLCACSAVLGIEEVTFRSLDDGAIDEEPHDASRRPDSGDAGTIGIVPPAEGGGPADATSEAADACVRRSSTNTAGLSSCEARVDGKYCGDSTQLNPKTGVYPNKNDLVVCANQKIAVAKPCGRCLALPPSHSDECDPCDCLPDGYHCGRDLPEWNTIENSNVQLRCASGVAAEPPRLCTVCTSGAQAVCPAG